MSRFARFRAAALLSLASLGASSALAATDVQVVTSPGGITAWLVEEPSIPILALEMRFDGGSSRDPADKTGATSFMASMLDEGAGGLDAAAFEKATDDIALRMSFGAGGDAFTVSARMLTENREASLAMLKLAMTEPRFDAQAMERVRRGILSSIRSRETDDGALASRAWRTALMGDDPYARESTEDGVLALTPEDLEAARRRAMNRSRLSVAVVGDITAEELGPLLDDLLLDLPDAPWEPLPQVELSQDRGIQIIDLDVPQSTARLVHEGLPRDDPDFIPAFVMNYVLGGGGFSSRLTVEVRQKRGLTYGVGSGLANFDRAPLMIASLSSSNDRMAEALDVVKAEWARMAEGGITAQELEDAKRYLTGAYPLRFDSNAKIAGQLVGLMSLGFTPDYIRDRNGLIEAVTLEDVSRVAERLLRPDRLHVVVVGRPEGLGDG